MHLELLRANREAAQADLDNAKRYLTRYQINVAALKEQGSTLANGYEDALQDALDGVRIWKSKVAQHKVLVDALMDYEIARNSKQPGNASGSEGTNDA